VPGNAVVFDEIDQHVDASSILRPRKRIAKHLSCHPTAPVAEDLDDRVGICGSSQRRQRVSDRPT
jgi:hypothetical protein